MCVYGGVCSRDNSNWIAYPMPYHECWLHMPMARYHSAVVPQRTALSFERQGFILLPSYTGTWLSPERTLVLTQNPSVALVTCTWYAWGGGK